MMKMFQALIDQVKEANNPEATTKTNGASNSTGLDMKHWHHCFSRTKGFGGDQGGYRTWRFDFFMAANEVDNDFGSLMEEILHKGLILHNELSI